MKTSAILQIEKSNTDSIFLFKEGIFWRCYEISAWYFIINIREYKIFKKFIKTVNQDIVYLGFPDTIIEEIIKITESKNYSVIKNEKVISINGIQQEEGFKLWKKSIKMPEKENETENKESNNQIIRKIIEFPIMNKTPIDAFNFLVEIQKQLNDSTGKAFFD